MHFQCIVVEFAIEQISCDVTVTLPTHDGKKITAQISVYGLREAKAGTTKAEALP